MFVMIKSIGVTGDMAADARTRLRSAIDAAGALPGITGSAVIETAPRALNGGALMWRATFADEAGYWPCVASGAWRFSIAPVLDPATGVRVDGVAYTPLARGGEGIAGGGTWRMLFFACEVGASSEAIAEMESDHLLMPRYISEMRAWAIGRVAHAEGRRRWTHVWEQEYDTVEAFTGAYMNHPVHWGLVDRWYDPECPERVADASMLVNAFGPIAGRIM